MKRNDLERALSALGRIPVERIEEICDAERDGRVIIKPKPKFHVGDTVQIRDAMEHSWIGRTSRVASVSNYLNCPISYRLDIGGGDWMQSMLTRAEAEEALKGDSHDNT